MRKILPIILLVAMLLVSVLAIVPASAEESATQAAKKEVVQPTDQPVDGSIEVSTWQELTNSSHKGKAVHFKNDIEVPVSKFTNGTLFGSSWGWGPETIDGRGHTLKVVDDTNGTGNAFCIWHGSNMNHVMKNLKIEGTFLSNTNTSHVGIIIRNGCAGLTVDNVVIDANMTVNAVGGGTGMLVGKFDWGKKVTFNNVHLYGTYILNADVKKGSDGDTGYMAVGGFVGSLGGEGTFTNCTSDVDITVKNVNNTGVSGFVGIASKPTFENCSSTGSITANGTLSWANVGGFVGYSNATQIPYDNCTVDQTISVGTSGILSNAFVGGFHGKADGAAQDLFTDCDASLKVDVKGSITSSAVGGFVGQTTGTTIIGEESSTDTTDVAVNMNFGVAVTSTNIGGLIGNAKGRTEIYSAIVTGAITQTVSVNNSDASAMGVGGLVGNLEADADCKIVDSVNRAVLTVKTSRTNAGGIIARVGGATRLTVDNCENHGAIYSDVKNGSSTSSVATGGIVGHSIGSKQPASKLIVTNCANYAALSGVMPDPITNTDDGRAPQNHMFGGVVGRICGVNEAKIENCWNTGDIKSYIKGYAGAGGILGSLETYNYTWSTNLSPTITVSKCVNTGKVETTYSGDGGYIGIGGIVGLANQINTPNAKVTVEECANFGAISGRAGVAGIFGCTGGAGDGYELVINKCYNAGKAEAGIVSTLAQAWGTSYVQDANLIKSAYKVPKITNCVNEGEVTYGIIKAYSGATDDYNTNPYVEISNCVSTIGAVAPDETKYHVTAATDSAATVASVKAGICANTALHDVLKLNTYLAATCEDDGHNAHYYCDTCGTYWDADKNETTEAAVVIPSLHDQMKADSANTWIAESPATCTTTGTKAHYHCATCNKNYDSSLVEITDLTIPTLHDQMKADPSNWIAKVDAQCGVDGTLGHYHCASCNKDYDADLNELDSLVIDNPHKSLTWNAPKAPECGDYGYNGHYYCEDCGEYLDANYAVIDEDAVFIPSEHTTLLAGVVTAKKDPECDKEGFAAHYHCDTCDTYWDENKVLTTKAALVILSLHDAMEANGELIPEVAPTCDTEGVKAHYDCSTCGKKYDANWNELDDLTISTLYASIKELEELTAKINDAVEKLDVSTLAATLDELAQAIADAEANAKAHADSKDAALKNELIALIATAKQEAIDAADDALEAAVDELEDAIALKADATALENAYNTLDAAIKAAEKAAKDYTDGEIGTLNTTLTKAIDDAKAAAIQVANDNLATARQELAQAKKDLEDADAALEDKKADKAALNKAIEDLTAAIDLAKNAAKKYADDQDAILKEDLEDQIDAAKDELYGAIEDLREELENAVEALESLIGSNLEATADVLSAALDKLDNLLSETRDALASVDEENKKILEDALTAAELKVTAVIEKLMEDIEDAVADLELSIESGDIILDAKIAALNEALANAEAALKIAAAEDKAALLTKIKKADEALEASVKALQKELAQTKAELVAKDAEILDTLGAKDDSLKTFIIIVCVIASVAFAGCAAFVIYFFVDKKKKI